MTCYNESTPFDQAMELLIENGFNGVADTIGIMMNAAMRIERSRF
jgi:putative transposase